MSLSEFGLEGGATSSEGVPACHAMDLPLLTLIEGIHRASLSCHDQQVHRSTIDRKALHDIVWVESSHSCSMALGNALLYVQTPQQATREAGCRSVPIICYRRQMNLSIPERAHVYVSYQEQYSG